MSDPLTPLAEHLESLSLNSDSLTRKYVLAALEDKSLGASERKDTLKEILVETNDLPEAKLENTIDKLIETFDYDSLTKNKKTQHKSFNYSNVARPDHKCVSPLSESSFKTISPEGQASISLTNQDTLYTTASHSYGSEEYYANHDYTNDGYYDDEYYHYYSEDEFDETEGGDEGIQEEEFGMVNTFADMSDQELLETVFYFYDPDVIWMTIEATGFDPEAAMKLLLSVDFTPESLETSHRTPSQRVCRHFMHNGCFRKDCWFSHDVTSMICRFWLSGDCMKGPECEFLHGWPEQALQAIRDSTSGTSDISNNLINSTKNKSPGIDPTILNTEEEFPALSSNSAKLKSKNSPSKTGYSAVAQSLSSYTGDGLKFKKQPLDSQAAYESRKFPQIPNPMPFFFTGKELTKQYNEIRKDALKNIRLRNSALNKAHAAFQSGNAKLAKTFAKQGQDANKEARELNRKASYGLFYLRNPKLKPELRKSIRGEIFIDLHGLHSNEAFETLEELLYDFSGIVKHVWVVPGVGIHSKFKPRLLPTVTRFCNERGYRFKEYGSKGLNGLVCILI
ncbi:hypothetical protein H4219_005851 [Mycoemilia scoparia]|uniref:Uncharacterized protein n=1 Tax=Mycoemilia scoparia TaxID=417184 RepID=A0A9W7ZMQ6_9FUNG|nr:hypothetical protein H4219_005851 [Mycoemilia scoparia]